MGWQFACGEMDTLYSHFRKISPCQLNSNDVVAALDLELKEILDVKFGYWTHLQPLKSGAIVHSPK